MTDVKTYQNHCCRCRKPEVRPAHKAHDTPGMAKLTRDGRACEAGGGPGMPAPPSGNFLKAPFYPKKGASKHQKQPVLEMVSNYLSELLRSDPIPIKSITIFDYHRLLSNAGWKVTHRIECPLSSERLSGNHLPVRCTQTGVQRMQDKRILGTVGRTLLIAKRS